MAANASLLDQLMGAARNALPGERVKQKHWSDESVSMGIMFAVFSVKLFEGGKLSFVMPMQVTRAVFTMCWGDDLICNAIVPN